MGFLRVCLAVTTSLWRSRRSAGSWAGAADAPMEVYAAVVPAADVSRSIDDSEFVLERLATPSATNSNPVSVGTAVARDTIKRQYARCFL